MDLSTLNTVDPANTGAVLELRAPDGTPLIDEKTNTAITITLLGEDSDILIKVGNQQANRYLRAPGGAKITAEVSRSNVIEKLAKATLSWTGVGIGEDETPCNEENARRLYSTVHFIRDQALEFVQDRANFTKASPKN